MREREKESARERNGGWESNRGEKKLRGCFPQEAAVLTKRNAM